jgi:hypothetical protein
MVLRQLVAALLSGNLDTALVIRDWLDEKHSSHPEYRTYYNRLSDPLTLRMGTVWSLCEKFGDRDERRWAAKARREAVKAHTDARRYTWPSLQRRKVCKSITTNKLTSPRVSCNESLQNIYLKD